MANDTSTYRRLLQRFGLIGALVVVFVVGVLGWQWLAGVQLESVYIVGAQRADTAELKKLAAVPSDTALYAIEPTLVADRVQRHPWVEAASVMRLPTGALRVSVSERTPAALAMDADGRPAFYLDASGYCMPLAKKTANVPLLYGLRESDYRPVQPLEHRAVREALAALASTDMHERVSELTVEADSSIQLYTQPTGPHAPIAVRLGHGPFPEKLRTLRAFWNQAIEAQPNTQFSQIDLRFDGQVITREQPRTVAKNSPSGS